jgi:hypothetical protein
MLANSWVASQLAASQKGLSSMELVSSIETRGNECHCHIWLYQLEKLDVVEHRIDPNKKSRHRDQHKRKVTQIKLQLTNMETVRMGSPWADHGRVWSTPWYFLLYDTLLPRSSKNSTSSLPICRDPEKGCLHIFSYNSIFSLENDSVPKKGHSFSLFHFPPVIKNLTFIKWAVILLTKLRKQYTDIEQWGEAYVAGKNYPTIYEKQGKP